MGIGTNCQTIAVGSGRTNRTAATVAANDIGRADVTARQRLRKPELEGA